MNKPAFEHLVIAYRETLKILGELAAVAADEKLTDYERNLAADLYKRIHPMQARLWELLEPEVDGAMVRLVHDDKVNGHHHG